MGLFEKCGSIRNYVSLLENVSGDGFAFITHRNSSERIKVRMQILESDNGVYITNIDTIDFSAFRKAIKRNPNIIIQDKVGNQVELPLSNREWRFIDNNTDIYINQQSLKLQIKFM